MLVVLKFTLFLGIVLLLGAGVFGRYIGPELGGRPASAALRWGLVLGALLLAGATAADVLGTLARAVGTLDPGLVWEYLVYTRHGLTSLVRLEIVAILLALGARRPPSVRDRVGHVVFGLGLLATFTWISHAGSSGDMSLVVADLVHLAATAAWAGAIIYLAWLPVWSEPRSGALLSALRRVSSVGLISVLLLIATGIYATFAHLFGVAALTTTEYGRALLYKHIAIVVILMIAGANRWFLLPKVSRQGALRPLASFMKIESLLLVAVLALTGLLTTREPAHEPGHHATSHHERSSAVAEGPAPPQWPGGGVA